jgi:hypothetical protein
MAGAPLTAVTLRFEVVIDTVGGGRWRIGAMMASLAADASGS